MDSNIPQQNQTISPNPQNPPNLPQTPPEVDHYAALTQDEQKMVDLRLLGFTYGTISKTLNEKAIKCTEMSLKTFFAKDGKLHDAYEQIKKIRNDEIGDAIEKAKEILRDAAPKAAELLAREVDNGQIEAASSVLDRTGINRRSDVNHSGTVNNDSIDRLTQTIGGFLTSQQHPKA